MLAPREDHKKPGILGLGCRMLLARMAVVANILVKRVEVGLKVALL